MDNYNMNTRITSDSPARPSGARKPAGSRHMIGALLCCIATATACGGQDVRDWSDSAGMLQLAGSMQGLEAPASVAQAPKSAQRTTSGLASRVLVHGSGEKHPRPRDTVTVHYTGWTTDGVNFDSSFKRGRPAKFPLNRVIKGWTEGVQLMVVGERRRFWIPEALAYKGRIGRPQGMLVFDVELLNIKRAPKAPPVPTTVKTPPPEAKMEASGLATQVLRKGTGTLRPTLQDRVHVHYTGWTTDGKMFDSSVVRGEPIRLKRTQVIQGWNEALGLMVAGEKRRVWIPEVLAYKGRPGRPLGMLVFDIELIAVERR